MAHAIFWQAMSKTAQPITPIYHMRFRSTTVCLLLTCHSPICIFVCLDKLSFSINVSFYTILSPIIKTKRKKKMLHRLQAQWGRIADPNQAVETIYNIQSMHLTTYTFSNKVVSRAFSNSTEIFLGRLKMDLNINPQNQSPTQIKTLITGSQYEPTM